jgi:hypothetical protein
LAPLCSKAATITGRPPLCASDCKNDMDICPPSVTMYTPLPVACHGEGELHHFFIAGQA